MQRLANADAAFFRVQINIPSVSLTLTLGHLLWCTTTFLEYCPFVGTVSKHRFIKCYEPQYMPCVHYVRLEGWQFLLDTANHMHVPFQKRQV